MLRKNPNEPFGQTQYLEGNVEQKLKTISPKETIKIVHKDSAAEIIQNDCK